MSSFNKFKTAQYCIKDLQSCIKTTNGFKFHDDEFIRVIVGGNVGTQKVFGDKIIITISDGTATINCMLLKDRTPLKAQILKDYEGLQVNADSSDILKAIGIVTTSAKRLLDRTYCEDLKKGEFVRIVGKMRYSKTFGKYIYIDQIERLPNRADQIFYLNMMQGFPKYD